MTPTRTIPFRAGPPVPPPPPAYTVADTLAALSAAIPPELVDARALRTVLATAAHLPAALTSWLYLETRLDRDGGPVDGIYGVEGAARDILAGTNPAIRLPEALLGREEWLHVQALAGRWADPASPLHRAIERVWLEYDAPGEGVTVFGAPVPVVFVDFAAAAYAPERSVDERTVTTSTALAPLFGGGLPSPLAAGLRRCMDALPPRAAVPYAGVLLSRGGDAVRLCVRGLRPGAVPGFLARAGWTGDGAELADRLAWLAEMRDQAATAHPANVHLDVSADGVLPAVGLEYTFERPGQARGVLRETAFLDRLVDAGLCTPTKHAGMLRWPGHTVQRFAHQLWRSVAVRRLNHVKAVHHPGADLLVKAYASVHLAYHPRA
ncbi:MAG: hypothetical protein JWM27_2130 [Gemmatimonadetes bacterium]|nr:hypothetical protein [Gemmatimonadota bacterium]